MGGSFVASTLNIADTAFLAGGDLTFSGSSQAAIINYGRIGALGGDIVLSAAQVTNAGTLTAANGTVGLLAGTQVLLRDQADLGGKFAVQIGAAGTSVTNSGDIAAAAAELRAENGNVYALAGNTQGVIRATEVSGQGGQIQLTSVGGAVDVAAGATLDASASQATGGTGSGGHIYVDSASTTFAGAALAKGGAAGGDGGLIETSGTTIDFTGATVNALGPKGAAGTWLIDPQDLTLSSTDAANISSALATANVTITSTSTGGYGTASGSTGNITLNGGSTAISWTSGTTLSLTAAGSIILNSPINLAAGGLTLNAASALTINSPITVSSAGAVNLTYSTASVANLSFGLTSTGFEGSLSFNGTNSTTGAPTGSLTINGQAYTLLNGLAGGGANDVAGIDTTGDAGYYALATSLTGTSQTPQFTDAPVGSQTDGSTFTGTFEGLGHTITNLTVTDSNTRQGRIGLFGQSQGVIRDIGLIGGSVTAAGSSDGELVGYMNGGTIANAYATGSVSGLSTIGGLVGQENAGASITNAYATGSVTGRGSYIGGLVGGASGAITDAFATGTVKGLQAVGGLVGESAGGAITNAYATGAVTATSLAAGGLVGENGSGSITDAYATGTVAGGGYVGGLVGFSQGDTVTNAYAIGSGATTAQLASATVLAALNSNGTTAAWGNGGNQTTPYLLSLPGPVNLGADTSATPTVYNAILTAAGLQAINANTSANYVLANSLNLTGITYTSAVIGTFSGTFEGLNNTITGLTIASSASNAYVGLFGKSSGAINDIGLVGGAVSGDYVVGSLVGEQTGGSITNAYATGSVGGGSGVLYVGGLVGGSDGTITNAYATGAVSVSVGRESIGGLVGFSDGTITNAYATGSVSAGNGDDFIGGLVGESAVGSITNAYATGAVSGTGGLNYAGGLVGADFGDSIINAYATGAVSATGGSGNNVGGLVGADFGDSIINAYATGAVSATGGSGNNVGGLVGDQEAPISDAYATGAVSATGNGNNVGGLVGYQTAPISDAYATGAVSATGSGNYVGGLVGYQTAPISDAYATGAVSAPVSNNKVGGLIGFRSGANAVTNSYYDTTTTGQSSGVGSSSQTGVTGTTTAGLAASGVLSALNTGGVVWGDAGNQTTPYLVSLLGPVYLATDASATPTPYTPILTAAGLSAVNTNTSANYVLANSLNLTGTTYTGAVISTFSGVFEGLNNTITGLTISASSASFVGLFGQSTGTIRDIGVVGASVSGYDQVGGLVGLLETGGSISNAYVTGSVSGSGDVGGLVGEAGGSITNAYATASVSGTNEVGGLVGNAVGSITNAYATGSVSAGNDGGGLVGYQAAGLIMNAYATGAVSGANAVGGLVGDGYNGSIINVYATGAVSGTNYVGGLVGEKSFSGVIDGYYDTSTTGTGTDAAGATGEPTSSLQGGLPTGFTTAGGWKTGNGLYPYLTALFPNGVQAVSGFAYSNAAGTTAAASGASGAVTVGLTVGGVSYGSATTGSNGYYYFALPAGTISTSGSSVLAYLTSTNSATLNTLLDAPASSGVAVSNFNLLGSTLKETADSSIGSLFALNAALGTAAGTTGAAGLSFVNQTITTAAATFDINATPAATSAGVLTLSSANTVTDSTGAIAVNSVVLGGGGAFTLNDASNSFANLSTASSTGAITVADTGALAISGLTSTGAVSVSTTGALSTTGTISAGGALSLTGAGITLGGNLSDGAYTTTLTAGTGAISQSSGVITAGTLTGGATGGVALTGANAITDLGAFTNSGSGGFSLTDAQSLTVTGTVSPGQNQLTLTTINAGTLILDGALSAVGQTVKLTSAGAITQAASGAGITAAVLTGSAGGSATLTGTGNTVTNLGAFTTTGAGANFAFTDGGSFNVIGAVEAGAGVGGSGTLSLTTTAGGSLTIGANLTADGATGTVDLVSDAGITQNGGVITANTLEGSAGGVGYATTLTQSGNAISNLYGFAGSGAVSLTDSSALTVTGAVSSAGQLTLTTTSTGGLILGANLTASGSTVDLVSAGAIIQTGGAITVATLTGSAAGAVTLTDNNLISTLGGFSDTAGAFSLTNNQALTVGGAVTATGAATLKTAGNLTLSAAGSVSSSGATTNAVTLDATGAFINNNASASAVSATGANGRWLIYSANPANDTFGSLASGNTAVWNTAAGASVSQTGERYVFAYQPTLTVTTTNDTKTYGHTTTTNGLASDYTITGYAGNGAGTAFTLDASTNIASGTPMISSTGTASSANVGGGSGAGNAYTITASAGTLTIGDGYNATPTFANSGLLTINPLAVTLSGTQVYNGTTTALGSNLTVANLVSGDSVTVGGTGTMAAKDVIPNGTEALTSLTNLTLNNSNYTLVGGSGAVTVTPEAITVTATGGSKVYDGGTTSGLVPTVTNGTLYAGDATLSQTYNSKDVATATTLTPAELFATGKSVDYTVTNTSAAGTITPYTLTAALTGTVSKTYDSTNAATLGASNYSLSSGIGSDPVSLVGATSGTYANVDVASGIGVSVSGLTLANNAAGDYKLAASSLTANIGTIIPEAITVTAAGGSKVYDGGITSGLTPTVASGTLYAGDATLSQTYNSKDVATATTLTPAELFATGKSIDYTVTNTAAAGTITPYTLTAGLTGSVSKTYNSTNAATLTASNYTLTPALGGDTVSLNNPTSGTYASVDAAPNILVSVSGLSLATNPHGDYQLASTSLSANIGVITAEAITLTAASGSKVYDGGASSSLTPTVTSGTLYSGDAILSQTYNTADVNSATTLTPTELFATGKSVDYTVTNTSAAGTITPYTLTASLTGAVSKTYDSTNAATLTSSNYSLSSAIGSDNVSLVGATSGTYASVDATSGIAVSVSVSGLTLANNAAGDYKLAASSLSAGIGTITPEAITVTAAGGSKVYDGGAAFSLTPTVTNGTLYAGDATLSQTYNSKDVATATTLTPAELFATGKSVDYTVTNTSAAGTITPYTLTAALTGTVSKTYDSTNAATLGASNYSLSSGIGSDPVSLVGATSGTYANVDVASGIGVSVSGLTLANNAAGDYKLAASSLTANIGTIIPEAITVTAAGGSKVYDGGITSGLTPTVASGTLYAGDATLSQTYNSKDVATATTLTPAELFATGKSIDYTVTNTAAAGTITPYTLTAGLTGSVSKTYNSTNAATLTASNYTLTPALGGDTVSLNNPTSGTYASVDAAPNILVSVSGLSLATNPHGDYQLASTSLSANIGVITAEAITVTAAGGSKVYDGGVASSLTPTVTNGTLYSGDATRSQTYNTADVNSATTLTPAELFATGKAVDYTVTNATAAGTITPYTLIAGLTGSVSKTYDSTNAATLGSSNYSLTSAIGSDPVSLVGATSGTYASVDATTGIAVSVSGLTLANNAAGDYKLASTSLSANIGTITPEAITVTAAGGSKVYDGGIASGRTPTVTSGTLYSGDAALSQTYNTADVNTATTLTPAELFATGKAVDYTVTNATAAGTITPYTLTAALTGTVSKTYDSTNAATLGSSNYSLTSAIGSDPVSLVGATSGTYASVDATTGIAVSVSGLTLANNAAGDYKLASTSLSANIGTITPEAITVTAAGGSKVYDGGIASGRTPTVTSGTLYSGDAALSQTYNTADVNTATTLTPAELFATGKAVDYTVTNATAAGTITPYTLTAALTGTVSKTYDSTNTATLTSSNYSLTSGLGSDPVSLVGATSGTYASVDATSGIAVSVSGLTLANNSLGDYKLASNSLTANIGTITPEAITVAATGGGKVYDGGVASSLTPAVTSGTLYGGDATLSQTYNSKDVATATTLTPAELFATGKAIDYTGTNATAAGTITPYTLTAALTGTVSKTYDSTNAATLGASNYSLTSAIGSDPVSLVGATSGTYASVDATSGIAVSVSSLTLANNAAGDYKLAASSLTANIGTITPEAITVTATGGSKVYDGGTTSGLVPTVTNGTLYAGDATLSQTYNSKDVSTATTLTPAELFATGKAVDYTVTNATAAGTITPYTLTAALTGTVSKTYDSTNAATLGASNYSLTSAIGSDPVSLVGATSGTYASVDATSGIAVSVSSLTLANNAAGDYKLASTSLTANIGVITPEAITVTAAGGSKVYDGGIASGRTPTVTSGTLYSGDAALSQTYNTADVNTATTLTPAELFATGKAVDYTVTNATAAGTITPYTLTAALTGTVSKTYDSTNTATLTSSNYSLTSGLGSDPVSLVGATSGTYASVDATSGIAVSVSGLTLANNSLGDYKLASTSLSAAIGTITPEAITVTAAGGSKVYDGGVASSLTPTVTSGTLYGGDATLSQTYNSKDVSTATTLTPAELFATGKAVDYTVTNATAAGTITPYTLTAALTGTVSKTYDSTNTATLTSSNYSLTSGLGSDPVSLVGATSGTYASVDATSGIAVSVSSLTLANNAAGDYKLASTSLSANIGVITPEAITVTAAGGSKVYDGGVASSLTPTVTNGTLYADDATLSQTYNSKDVSTATTLTPAELFATGKAVDYTVTNATAAGTITPYTLTASLTGTVSKTYDATNAATLGASNYTLTPAIAGDTVTLNGPTSGTYAIANAGTGLGVSVAGLNLVNNAAGDYQLAAASLSANVGTITAEAITIAAAPNSKVYDGGTTAAATPTVTGTIYGADTLSEVYTTANAGTGLILVPSATLANASNYAVTYVNSTAGTITPAPLAASLIGTVEKTYDGTAAATLAPGDVTLIGFIAGQGAAVTQTSGTYASANVGTGIEVSATLAPSSFNANIGTLLANYSLPTTASGAVGVIEAAPPSSTGDVQAGAEAADSSAINTVAKPFQAFQIGSNAVGVNLATAAAYSPQLNPQSTGSPGAGLTPYPDNACLSGGGQFKMAGCPR